VPRPLHPARGVLVLVLGVGLAALLATAPASAQPSASGSEFQVNTNIGFGQFDPDATVLPGGEIVIVFTDIFWEGSGAGVFARRFDSTGAAIDPNAFLVNLTTAGAQGEPAIGRDDRGNFVVVWTSYGQDGDSAGIFGRVFGSSGAPLTGEFQVNEHTPSWQRKPALSVSGEGNFVVAWESNYQDGDYLGVFARQMSPSGAPLGGEFPVNLFTTGQQREASVATDLRGNFVVTWHSYGQDGSGSGIIGRRFGRKGAPISGEFIVNEWTTSTQKAPRIAMHPTGEFVVTWRTFNADGSGYGVAARRFHLDGDAAGPEILVNEWTTGWQQRSDVEMDAAGNFVVVWDSYDQYGEDVGLFARVVDAGGIPAGGEFQVNTYTTSDQWYGAVATGEDGGFVLAWRSEEQDGNGAGVFARRYDAPDVCGLLDGDSDGLGDLCDVALIAPVPGEVLDCADPKSGRPWVAWGGGGYDRFRVEIASDPNFTQGLLLTSGKKLKKGGTWRPSTKKWKKVCRSGAPDLFVRLFGVDNDVPKGSPGWTNHSQVIQAEASY
jgi:hypothetical protein